MNPFIIQEQIEYFCVCQWWNVVKIVYYNRYLRMKNTSSPEPEREASPRLFFTDYKEDAEDRLATRNSFQMTIEQTYIESAPSKRKKLQIVQQSRRHCKQNESFPTMESIGGTKILLPVSLNQNQRINVQKQSANLSEDKVDNRIRTKRNKIFNSCFLQRRFCTEIQEDAQNATEIFSSTRIISNNLQDFRVIYRKKRSILHQINPNPPDQSHIVNQAKNESQIKNENNLCLSYPKFTSPVQTKNDNQVSPDIIPSRIFMPNLQKSERMIYARDETQKHINPVSQKIKQAKKKKKSLKCSFSKLTLEKPQTAHRIFGGDSRSSNCLLPECLIKDNLANYNIKVVQSCSSDQQEAGRYYDVQQSPIRQRISYRNIDILNSNQDEVLEEKQEVQLHNLFSDFDFPSTPVKEKDLYKVCEGKIDNDIFTRSTKKTIPLRPEKNRLHLYLIGTALLLLFVQLLG